MAEDQADAQPQGVSSEEIGRMWQHGLHLDTMLFQRGNLFLVAQSLLLVSFTGILGIILDSTKGVPSFHLLLAARVVAVFGLLLTIVWSYIGHRHLRYYTLQSSHLRAHLTEYRLLRGEWRSRGPSSLPLVTYFLPALAGALWIVMLALTWR
jgi:hypothetical protein